MQAIEVVALALKRKTDQKYLLARRGPGQSGSGEWEFPGGKVEASETQQEALVREILEELSLTIEAQNLKFISDHIENYPQKTVHIYLWGYVVEQDVAISLTEHDAIKWCLPTEILQLNLSSGDRPFVSLLK